jgi:hypothetical protein
LVKTKPILIFFNIQNATSFVSGKKCSEVCEGDNLQINGRIFALTGLSPCLGALPPPLTATKSPHLDVGENAATVKDMIHIQELFSGL